MSPMKSNIAFNLGVAIGIILIIAGSISLISGLEYDRSMSGQQTVQSLHAYSFVFHSSAGANVHIEFDLTDGNMSMLITNPEGHDEIVLTGYPSDENIMLVLNDKSEDSIDWTPSTEGSYYIVFMQLTDDVSTLQVSISYTGMSPELIQLGIILIVLGTAVAVVNILLKNRRPKGEPEGLVIPNESNPPDG